MKDKSNGHVLFLFSSSVSKAICSQLQRWRLSEGLTELTPKLIRKSRLPQKTITHLLISPEELPLMLDGDLHPLDASPAKQKQKR